MQDVVKEEETGHSITRPKLKNRILLVDYEPDITFTFTDVLEDEGFEVDSFNDPHQALSNFSAGTYDVTLIDIRMPQMNGFDQYRKLKNKDDKVKYCFMTAYEVYYETLKKDLSWAKCWLVYEEANKH